MAQMGHVDADLVGTSGFQLEPDQGMVREAFHHPEVGDRGPPSLTHGETLTVHGVASDGGVHSATGGHGALHQGQIFPMHGARLQLLHQPFVGL